MNLFRYRYAPLVAYLAFAGFVVCCLLLGPVKFRDIGYGLLLSFLAAYLALFFIGFVIGGRGKFRIDIWRRKALSHANYLSLNSFIGRLLFFAFIYTCYSWVSTLASGVSLSMSDMGQNYSEAYAGYVRGSASIDYKYILNIIFQAIVTLSILFGISYFREMATHRRYMLLFIVFSYVAVNMLSVGKQKYLGDIVLYASAAVAVSMAANESRVSVKRVLQVSGILLAAVALFTEIQTQRYNFAGTGVNNIAQRIHPLMTWDVNSPLVTLLGEEYGFGLGSFLVYFSNGLYGLYLSLTLPFEWTYFFGNSYSVGRIVEILIGQDGAILHHTYPYRVDITYGWGFDKWHSAFAWFASDVGFFGVLFLTPFFAAFYARLWREAVNSLNPVSAPLFIYLSMGLAFSFSNNQIFHTLSGVIVFFVLLVLRKIGIRKLRAKSH